MPEYCEKCQKYGILQEMKPKKLEPLEVKKKLIIGKICDSILYGFVYLGYIYYECPICHWFKFIKKD